MHLETATARIANRVSAKVATETTVEDSVGNKAVIATIEAAVNKVATETTGVTEAATDVPPTVANEVVEPSTTTTGPVPVATT